jgi:hypothetical protein
VAIQAYRQAWEHTRAIVAGTDNPSVDQCTHLFRVATRLAELHHQEGDHVRSRAVLETALDLLRDPDQRDIIRCRLARAALVQEDISAFSAWMRDSNPHAIKLEVDTDYRCSMALWYLHEGDYRSLLVMVGSDRSEVPLAPHEMVPCLRAHALAAKRRHDDARREIALFARERGVDVVARVWSATPGPSTEYAKHTAYRAVQEALDPRPLGPAARRVAAPAPPPPPTPRRRLSRRSKGAIVLAVVALGFVPLGYTMVPLRAMMSGGGEPLELALRRVRRCPAARMALGRDIDWAVGRTSGSDSGLIDAATAQWMLQVKGRRRRGELSFRATASDGQWRLRTAVVSVEEEGKLDVLSCQPQPMRGRGSGVPGSPGARQLPVAMPPGAP